MLRILLRLTLFALALTALSAYPCHVPDTLRHAEGLTAKQRAVLSAGHAAAMTKIAYDLKAVERCSGGTADIFPCRNVDLLGHLPLGEIGGGNGNDLWGWVDPQTGREYALVGRSNGTAFVDVTNPENPLYLGNLPTHAGVAAWRDIKVYRDHAFVVADFAGNHGMQVFDLRQLRQVTNPPVTFQETAHHDGFPRAHNIVINEDTGFAYAVGLETANCQGGLYIMNVRNPTAPSFVGCYGEDGYTHDAQCVIYNGADADYRGQEICFASNEDSVTIVNVNNKSAPFMIARVAYDELGYVHQGWLTPDHRFFVQDDELDETRFGHNTRTYVWDVSDLDQPRIAVTYTAPESSIDHNQYVRGDFAYQANYRRGLRILRIPSTASGTVREVAYFDTFPEANGNGFDGA